MNAVPKENLENASRKKLPMPHPDRIFTKTVLFVLLAWAVMTGPARAVVRSVPVRVDFSAEEQVIDNFGASDCWSMQRLGTWSLENRNRIADLLFSSSKGIGLSCWRFNLGAGKNPDDITNPWRTVETFEVSEGVYDWSRQGAEQWFLAAAKARGVEQFVAFANSPPARMTRNGLTRCSDGPETTNLKDGYEGQFARYLADIAAHFRDHPDPALRIPFDWISPVNEPQWDWNGRNQEGNRAANKDIKAIVLALHGELLRQGLATKILVPESGHLHGMTGREFLRGYQRTALYGNYINDFCGDPQINDKIGNVLCCHSYLSDVVTRLLVRHRQKMREAMDAYPEWKYWMTEYCIMQGARNEGGGGRDTGMRTALDVARVIHCDLTLCNASAWQWWTAVSPCDYKDGLIYTDYQKAGDPETIYPAKTLWALGNFSRFIRPGARRIEMEGADDVRRFMGSAFKNAGGDTLTLVFINMTKAPVKVILDLQGLPEGRKVVSFTPHVTSEEDDLRTCPMVSADSNYTVPGCSCVTLVGELTGADPR